MTRRRRRTPEVARAEILAAAERLLIEKGPGALTFQKLARAAGLSASTVHHHFGGVEEIQTALVERLLDELVRDIAEVLSILDEKPLTKAKVAIFNVYKQMSQPRYAKMIAWVSLSTTPDRLDVFATGMGKIEAVVSEHLVEFMPAEDIGLFAKHLIYRIAIQAIGEGLAGPYLRSAMELSEPPTVGGDAWLSSLLSREFLAILSKAEEAELALEKAKS